MEAGDGMTGTEWGDFFEATGLEVGFGHLLTEDGGTEALLMRFHIEGRDIPIVVCDRENILDVLTYLGDLTVAYRDWCARQDAGTGGQYDTQVRNVITEATNILEGD